MHRFIALSKQSPQARFLVKRQAFGSFLLLLAMLLGSVQSFSFLSLDLPVSETQAGFRHRSQASSAHLRYNDGRQPSVDRLVMDREPEIEEEDETHPDDDLLAEHHRQHGGADESLYASQVGTKLSWLQSLSNQRAPLDFVVLFHCWKSDPC